MSGTFTPMPASAPALAKVRAQASMEFRLLLRNGEQLLLALVIPVIVLVGGTKAAGRLGVEDADHVIAVLPPGVLALAIMSSAFTSLAIATGFERRYGVIKRLGSSPLSRTELLLGKVAALSLLEVLQFLVLGGVAFGLGWRPEAAGAPYAVLIALLGTAAFGSLGLLVAGLLRAEATLAAANLVYLLLMAGGGVVLPSHTYGGFGAFLAWLPSGALGDGLRAALQHGALRWESVLVLLVWSLVTAVLTARSFKWE
jgi:ABC-2 type transport system permease protein